MASRSFWVNALSPCEAFHLKIFRCAVPTCSCLRFAASCAKYQGHSMVNVSGKNEVAALLHRRSFVPQANKSQQHVQRKSLYCLQRSFSRLIVVSKHCFLESYEFSVVHQHDEG